MKNRFKALVLLLVMVFVCSIMLGGCGSEPTENAKLEEKQTENKPEKQEEKFPTKPITLIVNYGPGSSSDLMCRPIADLLQKELGVPVNVVNKSGGSGTLGITELAKAKPDGYTIGNVTYTPMTVSRHLMELEFDAEDFEYIGAFGEWVYGLFCYGGKDWDSVEDVVAYAKANPGKLKHGYSSHANALPTIYLAEEEGLDVKLVPTGGGAESESLVAGGHLDTIARHPGILKAFNESEIRFLHPAGNERWESWERSDRPTLQEKGYDINVQSWIGFAVPKGVPEERLKIINEAIVKVCNEQKIKDNIFKIGLKPMWMDGKDYKKFIDEGYEKMGKILEKYEL